MTEYDDHMHKFFMFKNYDVYEPSVADDGDLIYRKIEWAILACNCGTVVKTKVKEQ